MTLDDKITALTAKYQALSERLDSIENPASALAKLSRIAPPSPARKKAAAENGKKGGRPKSPFDSTFHRDGSVTIWDCRRQQWVRTVHPSDNILASLSPEERAKIQSHVA